MIWVQALTLCSAESAPTGKNLLDILMHDVFLIHGAERNTSGKRRTGIALRYMPGTSVFERSISLGGTGVPTAFATRPLWLLRGKDRTSRNDFKVGH